MSSRKIKKQLFSRRVFILGGMKAFLLSILIFRLYYLQIIKEKEYKTISDNNRIRLVLIPPLRGKVLDRNGLPLAENENFYRMIFEPEVSTDRIKLAEKLAQILKLDEKDALKIKDKLINHRSRKQLMLTEHLTWEEVCRVEVNSPKIPGIYIDVGRIRYFPMLDKTPHIIGYLGPISKEEIQKNPLYNHPDYKRGISGIEYSYDNILRGTAGVKKMEVNAYGINVSELSREEPISGSDLKLTLDKELQIFAHERLSPEVGAANVIDIVTGEILICASTPGFDLNKFTYGISNEEWKQIINQHENPLTNKVLSNQYPPGSTFKPVVALAALKEGVDPDQRIYCPGHMTLGRRKFHCWKKEGHGYMDMSDAIKNSCNIYFYNTARKIGIENIEAAALSLGLGQIHDIGLNEQKRGRIPSPTWKRKYFNRSWQLGETLNVSIGQGDVLTTPFQLAIMTANIASGKYIVPKISREYNKDIIFKDLDIPVAHLNIVRKGMINVMNEVGGTAFGSRIAESKYQIAGKTGTSQVISRKFTDEELEKLTPYELKKIQNHALFIGYGPIHKPRYACCVVVEHGKSGSRAAAPIARDILLKVQTLYNDKND